MNNRTVPRGVVHQPREKYNRSFERTTEGTYFKVQRIGVEEHFLFFMEMS